MTLAILFCLSCTSTYHGPLRFSYENRDGCFPGENNVPDNKTINNRTNSDILSSGESTLINGCSYFVTRTSNNLWVLARQQPDQSIDTGVDSFDCCSSGQGNNDSSFCYNAINTFCEISELMIHLTGFNPLIRACLAAGLRILKPILQLMCEQNDFRFPPSGLLASQSEKKPPQLKRRLASIAH